MNLKQCTPNQYEWNDGRSGFRCVAILLKTTPSLYWGESSSKCNPTWAFCWASQVTCRPKFSFKVTSWMNEFPLTCSPQRRWPTVSAIWQIGSSCISECHKTVHPRDRWVYLRVEESMWESIRRDPKWEDRRWIFYDKDKWTRRYQACTSERQHGLRNRHLHSYE